MVFYKKKWKKFRFLKRRPRMFLRFCATSTSSFWSYFKNCGLPVLTYNFLFFLLPVLLFSLCTLNQGGSICNSYAKLRIIFGIFFRSQQCLVTTFDLYRLATIDAARLSNLNYVVGEKRGTFSNHLSTGSNIQPSTVWPTGFFLLNSRTSYNFLCELKSFSSRRNYHLLPIFSLGRISRFINMSHFVFSLEHTETIYNVFLYTYLLAFLSKTATH